MEISVEKPQQPETSELVEQAAEISQVFLADDADDDEEEVEPKLKYERLSNDIAHILKIDASSCIAVHPKVLPKLKSKSKHFLKLKYYIFSVYVPWNKMWSITFVGSSWSFISAARIPYPWNIGQYG